MTTQRERLARMETEIRRRLGDFWNEFSDEEIEIIFKGGDEKTIAKIDKFGGPRLWAIVSAVMNDERAALKAEGENDNDHTKTCSTENT
jgi:hypothetical protein